MGCSSSAAATPPAAPPVAALVSAPVALTVLTLGPATSATAATPSVTVAPPSGSPRLSRATTTTSLALQSQQAGHCRRPCKFGLKCYRKKLDHLKDFCHPGDSDYPASVRKHKIKGEFHTFKACFDFVDPIGKGIIDDKKLLGELMWHLDDQHREEDQLDSLWSEIDDDGNGFASFPEFVEWANNKGGVFEGMKLGLDEECGPGGKQECGFMGCRCKSFRPADDEGMFCSCGHKKFLHTAPDSLDMLTPVPDYWSDNAKVSGQDVNEWVDCDDDLRQQMEALINASAKQSWTRDRGPPGTAVPASFEVVQVQRNENSKVWRKYYLKRSLIKKHVGDEASDTESFEQKAVKTTSPGLPDQPVDGDCNEWFLWHGSSLEAAKSICSNDFKVSLAGTTTGTLYGAGTYFADSSTKADEYAKETGGCFTLLLCRVVGGRVLYTDEVTPNSDQLVGKCLHGVYDSVLGDREKCRNTFKEFVVFSTDQVYAEFIVSYKRNY